MGEPIQKERSFRQVWVFARRHAAIVHLASARRRGRYNCPEGHADIVVAGECHSSCSLRPNLPIRGTLRSVVDDCSASMTKQAPTVQEVAISLPAFVPPPLPEASLRVFGASRLEEEHGCWRAKRVRRCGVVRVERIASVIPGGSPVRWHPIESLHAGFAQLCRHLTVREQWTLAVGSGWVPAGRE